MGRSPFALKGSRCCYGHLSPGDSLVFVSVMKADFCYCDHCLGFARGVAGSPLVALEIKNNEEVSKTEEIQHVLF